MNRIAPIDPSNATGKIYEQFQAIERKFGMVPNFAQVCANSSVALTAFLQFNSAVQTSLLSAKLREQLALAIAEHHGCEYCLAAHTVVGRLAGLRAEEVTAARHGWALNDHSAAALELATRIVVQQGNLTDEELDNAKKSGLTNGEIVEIVLHVAFNVFTNYLNNLAETVVDFPLLPETLFVAEVKSPALAR